MIGNYGNYTKVVGGQNCTFDDNDNQLWCDALPTATFYNTSSYIAPTVQPTWQQLTAPAPSVQPSIQQLQNAALQAAATPAPIQTPPDTTITQPIAPPRPLPVELPPAPVDIWNTVPVSSPAPTSQTVYAAAPVQQLVPPTPTPIPPSIQATIQPTVQQLQNVATPSTIPAPTPTPAAGNFFTDATIIGSMPNWAVLGIAGVLLFFVFKK